MATDSRDPVATIQRALMEADTARKEADALKVRQAAEKAWLSVVEATDEFLSKEHGMKIQPGPESHSERRRGLLDGGHIDMARDFALFEETLHGDCFYFGRCPTQPVYDVLMHQACLYVERTTGKPNVCSVRREVEDRAQKNRL